MEIKKTDFQIQIIDKIKELRVSQNMSQAQISEILGLNSAGLIGNIESPRYPHKYTLKQLYVLSTNFEFSFVDLFLQDQINKEINEDLIELLILKIIEYDG